MAYGLGYAGGYADVVGTYGDYAGGYGDSGTAPTPPPPAVGGGAPLYRRRWVARPVPPFIPPSPVRVRVRITVTYRWAATVVRTAPRMRMAAVAPRLVLRAGGVTIHIDRKTVTSRIEVKNIRQTLDPAAQNRHAWELRELNEIAVALAALE